MKTIKITDEAHKAMKEYCEENHLKMLYWASDTIKDKIENEQEEDEVE